MTTVQLVQLHSMLFEPILLYPNKLVSELDSFSSRTSPHAFIVQQANKLCTNATI